MNNLFRKLSTYVSHAVGTPKAFIAALLLVFTWGISGPIFNYSDTWQLFINTCTTIMTFLMVFLIQNTQNRDSKAIHLKLDELLKAIRGARNGMMNAEELSDEDLERLHLEFRQLQEHYSKQLEIRRRKLL